MPSKRKIIFIGTSSSLLPIYAQYYDTEVISSVRFLDTLLFNFIPDMIIFDSVYDIEMRPIRRNEKLSFVPVLILAENLNDLNNFLELSQVPRVLLCNTAVVQNEKIIRHIQDVIERKQKILPARTGKIVKQSILYINKNISEKITREAIASYSGVAEDYLSRIFHKEMGLALWDYVNDYRLCEAKNLLLETAFSIKEIAYKVGFEDPAYFNRLFTKRFNQAPGKFREPEE